MSESAAYSSGLNETERAMLDEFCGSHQAQTPTEQAALDQAASELRDQLKSMGLIIETEEQFYIACMVAVVTASNMRKLAENGLSITTAGRVTNMSIAALRPDQIS